MNFSPTEFISEQPTRNLIPYLYTGLLISLFYGIHRIVFFFFHERIPINTAWKIYYQDFLLIDALNKLGNFTIVILFGLSQFIIWRSTSWSKFNDKKLRYGITFITILLAWIYGLSSINYLFGQSYLFDRVIIIVSPLLVYLHPGFLVPYLIELLVFTSQFQPALQTEFYPLHTHLPVYILFLFVAFQYIKGTFDLSNLYFYMCTCAYAIANIIGPLLYRLANKSEVFASPLVFNFPVIQAKAQFLGWTGSLSEELRESLIHTLNVTTPFLNYLIIISLILSFFAFYKRSLWWISFCFVTGLLVVLGLVSGIILWPWILVLLLIGYWYSSESSNFRRFEFHFSIIFIVLVLFAPYLEVFPVTSLNGWTTKYHQQFSIKIATTKETIELNRNSLDPLDGFFKLDFFFHRYLIEKYTLDSITENPERARKINSKLTNTKNLIQLESQFSQNWHDADSVKKYNQIVRDYINNYTGFDQSVFKWVSYFQAPGWIFLNVNQKQKKLEELEGEITSVKIFLREAYLSTNKNIQYNTQKIHEIKF